MDDFENCHCKQIYLNIIVLRKKKNTILIFLLPIQFIFKIVGTENITESK